MGSRTDEPIRTWKQGDFQLDLWETSRTDWRGQPILRYEFRDLSEPEGMQLVFSGSDFSPSPMYAIDGDECVNALLDFLSLEHGDTDSEHFENYTSEQLEWRDRRAEELKMYVMHEDEVSH